MPFVNVPVSILLGSKIAMENFDPRDTRYIEIIRFTVQPILICLIVQEK